MGIRRDDPRTEPQRKVDDEIRLGVENGSIPRASKLVRKEAIELARMKKEARKTASQLGLGLSSLRRSFEITQEEVAEAIGTKRSAISRIEKGNYGGLTIERFLLLLYNIANRGEIGFETLLSRPEQPLPTISRYDSGVSIPDESPCVTRGKN